MFHRIIYDHWTEAVPILGFLLTFAVFLTALVRALLMKKEECETMAVLPLGDKATPCRCDKSCGCCWKKQAKSGQADFQTTENG